MYPYPNGKTQVVRVPVPVQPTRSIPPGVPPLPGNPPPDAMYRAEWDQSQQVWACLVWATPEWCRQVIETCNTHNRPEKPASQGKVRAAVEGGAWRVNGESVVFNTDGVLTDGQNRLVAIRDSGIAVPLLCVFGVHPDTFYTTGTATPRTRSDILGIRTEVNPTGEKNRSTLASCLTWLYRWENNAMKDYKVVPPLYEVPHILANHPGIRDSIKAVGDRCQKGVHSTSVFCTLHYLLGLSDARDRDIFFQRVLDNEDMKPGSNEALLNRWLRNKAGQARKHEHGTIVMAVVIKTWNRVRAGLPAMQNIVWRFDEEFPDIL